MSVAILVVLGLLLTVALAEGWLKVIKGKPKKKRSCRTDEPEKRNIVFRSTFVAATPAPLKVVHFVEGKVEGRIVMHGPYQGVVRRILMLWKEGKHRSIKMDALYAVDIDSIDKVYSTSVEEAKTIAMAVYGKKRKTQVIQSPPYVAVASQDDVVKPASVSVAPVAAPSEEKAYTVVKTVVLEPKAAPVAEADPMKAAAKDLTFGFISRKRGVVVDGSIQQHVSTRNGVVSKYEAFTLTLNTETGIETLTGVDLYRAYKKAGVKVGDSILAIHERSDRTDSGFMKKRYSVTKTS